MALSTEIGTAQPCGTIRFGTSGVEAYLSLEGRGTHLLGQPLRECLNEFVARGFRSLHIDLHQCSHMDSTFLGILTSAAMRLHALEGKLSLIGLAQRNLDSIRSLGIERFFEFENEESSYRPPSTLQTLNATSFSKAQWGETMLQAHRTLTECDERNVTRFRDVIECLEENLPSADQSGDDSSGDNQ